MQSTRDQEISDIHTKYKDFYQIGAGLLLVCIGIWIGSLIFADKDGYLTNVYTEVMSITVTILVLDRLNDYRARIREKEALQKRLVREARGQSNEIAKAAIDWLRAERWLIGEESLLKGSDLHEANLSNANLRNANLQNTNLRRTNLQKADLWDANVQNADLSGAYLQDANLSGVNLKKSNLRNASLQNSDLRVANLENTNLENINLRSANMSEVNLRLANLKNAELSSVIWEDILLGFAILPDGSRWTPETDMSRYTDPNHPEFWEPDWVKEAREKSGTVHP